MDPKKITDIDALTDAEIERLESRLFCAGGPPAPRRLSAQGAATPTDAAVRAPCKR